MEILETKQELLYQNLKYVTAYFDWKKNLFLSNTSTAINIKRIIFITSFYKLGFQ